MKTRTISLVVGTLVSAVAAVNVAEAQTIPAFPTIARKYTVWLARAMDKCTLNQLTVVGGSVQGCVAENTDTDNTVPMSFARLTVTPRSGRVTVFGRGLTFGNRVQVQLTIRVTQVGLQTKHPPGNNTNVTYQDHLVTCPPPATNPFGFPVRSNGVILGVSNLVDCLGMSSAALATGNIEIVDAALINLDTGKAFARPGIER